MNMRGIGKDLDPQKNSIEELIFNKKQKPKNPSSTIAITS